MKLKITEAQTCALVTRSKLYLHAQSFSQALNRMPATDVEKGKAVSDVLETRQDLENILLEIDKCNELN